MKRLWILLAIACLLTGCAGKQKETAVPEQTIPETVSVPS